MADVVIPHSKWRKLEEALKWLSPLPEMMTEDEFKALMGWSDNYYSHVKKTLPMDWYTVNAIGKRFYFKAKVLGL